MRVAFGDFELDWTLRRVRRGAASSWVEVAQDTADILLALMPADDLTLTAETLWRGVAGKLLRFDGGLLMHMIENANTSLNELEVNLVIKNFSIELVDVTPRALLRVGDR